MFQGDIHRNAVFAVLFTSGIYLPNNRPVHLVSTMRGTGKSLSTSSLIYSLSKREDTFFIVHLIKLDIYDIYIQHIPNNIAALRCSLQRRDTRNCVVIDTVRDEKT